MLKNGGFSGTDACILENGYYLARKGHYVVILADRECSKDGITFWDPRKIHQYDFSEFDVFSPLMFNYAPEVPQIIAKLPKRIVYVNWFHCFPGQADFASMTLAHIKGMHQLIITPSDYVTKFFATNKYNCPALTLHNGLNDTIFNVETVKERQSRKGNFIFHACYERGAVRSLHVFEKFYRDFNYGTFHVAAYSKEEQKFLQETCKRPNVKALGSLSKIEIRDALRSMDYFVYYLALEDTRIHHDTYGCCVHEALACGVIVISWDVACLREVYGDNIILVEPPFGEGYNPFAPFGSNSNFLTNEAIEKLYAKVKFLEENPKEKESLRRRAQAWALQKEHSWQFIAGKFESICQQYVPIAKPKSIENNDVRVRVKRNIDLVIARYKEDLTWLGNVIDYLSERYSGELRVFIYEKSGEQLSDHGLDNSKCTVRSEGLPNIGRESHTYLHHICKMYNDYVNDIEIRAVVFLQGSIQEHLDQFKVMCFKGCGDACALVDAFVNDVSCMGSTTSFAKTHEFLGGNRAHYGFKIDAHNGARLTSFERRPFGDWFKDVFSDRGFSIKQDEPLVWWLAGLFGISNKLIVKNRGVEFYRNLLDVVLPKDVNPEIGHFFERSWVYVFGLDRHMTIECKNDIARLKGKNGRLL